MGAAAAMGRENQKKNQDRQLNEFLGHFSRIPPVDIVSDCFRQGEQFF